MHFTRNSNSQQKTVASQTRTEKSRPNCQGCISTELRRKILEKPAMTLDGVLNKARALEAAATQANKMEIETVQTALLMRRNKPTRDQPNWRGQNDQHNEVNQPKQPMVQKNCSFCGGQFHQRLSICPATFISAATA
jgi:hypothetical protein